MAFEGLPEELMTLILVKLPVKSLLRSKCVRKSWYSLINSPQFILLHRSSSSSSSPQFILRSCVDEQPAGQILSFHSYETLEALGNTVNIPITHLGHPDLGWLSLSGSCDGLVCITNPNDPDHNDRILICNPALREFRSLFVPPSFGDRSGYHVNSVAFGKDPNTGEYKVVMIGVPYLHFGPDVPDEECINYTPYEEEMYDDREVKVYDFKTDSWRDTDVVIPTPFGYSRRAVSLNGSFHWCPFPWENPNVLSFNISDEVTDSIPLPDFVDPLFDKELFVYSKSQLALIVHLRRDDDLGAQLEMCPGRFEICVMTEYGVKESWTRLFLIGPLTDFYTPLAFWDEQQLLLQTMEGQLFSWDLQHQNLRYFPIYGSDVYPYSESLVSINKI